MNWDFIEFGSDLIGVNWSFIQVAVVPRLIQHEALEGEEGGVEHLPGQTEHQGCALFNSLMRNCTQGFLEFNFLMRN